MVNVKELRIGNYLQTKDFKLTGVTDIKLISITHDQEQYTFYCYGYKQDEVIPIALSEEWLLKLGFARHNKNWAHRKYYNINDFEIIPSDGFFFFKGYKIHYIHQLQNLYLDLIGEELLIPN